MAGRRLWSSRMLDFATLTAAVRTALGTRCAAILGTAGTLGAALFLREFVGDCKWMHLDIAGPAFLDRPTALAPKGGTGFGVLTLTQFIESMK